MARAVNGGGDPGVAEDPAGRRGDVALVKAVIGRVEPRDVADQDPVLALDAHDLSRCLGYEGAERIEVRRRGFDRAEVGAYEDVLELFTERQHVGGAVESAGWKTEHGLGEAEAEALQGAEVGRFLVARGVEVDTVRRAEEIPFGLVAWDAELSRGPESV